nr:xylulose kinase-1 [Tanacetum cinerariifolium]
MSSLFADTHNVVTILEKLDAAEGFEQIMDFLSGSYIHYALTVNPHIYISCIKQFWNTASVKRSADVTRLQALVDKKKIVISEVVIREILQLDDAEGIVCLPNEEIFAGLAQMGYEKPSTKLTFYKAFFSSQWNSPQAPPQGADFPTHIQQVLDVCSALTRHIENLENDNAAQKLEIVKLQARVKRLERANQVKSSKLRHLRKVGASRRVESSDDTEDVFNQGRMIDDMDKDEGIELAEIYNLDLDHSFKVLSMQEDDSEVQEVAEIVTTAKLITDVVTAASQVSAASATISAAKPSIPAAALIVVAAYTRR